MPRRVAARSSSTWEARPTRDASPGLTRERIVGVAMRIADKRGLAAVSMRNLASELKASPMALYYYIPSKHDLLNLMLDAAYGELQHQDSSLADWRSALHYFAWENRRCLKRHPWIGLLRTPDREYGPACIGGLEAFLNRLSQFGIEIQTAIRMLSALFVFVNGFVADEFIGQGSPRSVKPSQKTQAVPFSRAVLATGRFPHVERFAELGVEPSDDESFERALGWILDGIATEVPAKRSSSGKVSKRGPPRSGRDGSGAAPRTPSIAASRHSVSETRSKRKSTWPARPQQSLPSTGD